MLLIIGFFGCDPNRPHLYNPNEINVYSSASVDEEREVIGVIGEVRYNSVRQNGVRLFLVSNEFDVVDDDVNDSTSIYQLDADEASGYWLLGVYPYSSEPLMYFDRVSLEESSEALEQNVELWRVSENTPQEFLTEPDCYCSTSIWYLTYWSCEMESGWAWSECD